MSLVSYNRANQLSEDVLLVIFDYLDDQDLLRCETVCHQWRNIILSGRPWKRLFHRKIVSSPQWSRVWWDSGIDEKKLETVHYRGLCKAIIQEVNEIDNNWRTGKFQKTKENYDFMNLAHFTVKKVFLADFDYREWVWKHGRREELKFYNQTSMSECCIVIPRGSFAVTNTEIVVLWDKNYLTILDNDGQLISELQELDEDERISWTLASCCISGDHMAVISQTGGKNKLSLWNVKDPFKATRLKSRYFNIDVPCDSEYLMKMDEQYVAVTTFHNDSTSIHIFSKKTLDLHWQKTADGDQRDNFVYDKGMFLLYVVKQRRHGTCGLIEMYDVKDGHCFREMRVPVNERYEHLKYRVGFNSKFMVIAEWEDIFQHKLNIYDMKAVKNKKSADDLLVCTLDMRESYSSIMMDESKIFSLNFNKINIYNFGSFACFRNESKSVTLSLPWRSVWRSKGVDEEPLEPVHHMEAYREVLKYFYELDMNCRTAIKSFSINNVDLATFTFGDDYIGYRQQNPKTVTFDENMEKRTREINYKTLQISKTTHLSVMGKTIQLIDIDTGKVIKETKLKREAEDWHFNCNLLVCVHKIAEHKNLLSVWRIEHSSNLTHLKDVAIGDYDGSLQVDEMFIAVKTACRQTSGANTYNFISMKTFQVERSVSSRESYFTYNGGHLFLLCNDLVRILDVTSGTFTRDIRMEPGQLDSIICCANSNYVALVSCNRFYSKLHVFDLKCLKETDAASSQLLLISIDLERTPIWMLMNETRIVCLSNCEISVIDLKPIHRLRCPESF
jgi:F-box-like